VLCTRTKTYAMKHVETTNSLLLVPSETDEVVMRSGLSGYQADILTNLHLSVLTLGLGQSPIARP
jgi:Sister chromatid cohesion protein Dcc1